MLQTAAGVNASKAHGMLARNPQAALRRDPAMLDSSLALLRPWSGPFGGVPPFDALSVAQLRPALEAAMREQWAEIEHIAANSAPADFDNTLAAMERSGRALDRVSTLYNIYTATLSDQAVQAVERDMEPRLAAFRDRITQNTALFARIASVYERRSNANLTPEQQRLAWLYYTNFVRAGARLEPAAKQRLSAVNQRLAALFTEFGQNVLHDENERMLMLEHRADLAGLPDSVCSGAAAAAESRGLRGKWVIANTRSSVEPFLMYSQRRDLRERVWRNFVMRGDNGDARDNKRIVAEILELRRERARLLGHATYADWHLEDSMAKTPQRALELMESIWPAALARVREELADMQVLADRDGVRIAAWDYRYYAERVRAAKYDLDANMLKPYLELERLREGMFHAAQRLFGLRFTPVANTRVPTYHPDVRVWEVSDAEGHVGLWYFDPYARRGKQSGAWMSSYRNQESFAGRVTAIVSNNANFVKGAPGEPVLISWDDAVTLFHEFGHALHGLLSNVNYLSLSGTAVPRDFVEFPSQLFEHWLMTPEVLEQFAVHYRTGEPMPRALIDKVERARNFNQGFATAEFLASALVDMKLHLATEHIDPAQFERDSLAALGMPAEIVMRHRIAHFSHIFSGDGYAAGYYSYLWADTLVADAWEAFQEGAGPWDAALARRLREHVLAAGNTQDPAPAYHAFRGRDPDPGALMRKRGFPVS